MALMEGGYQTRRSDFGNDYYKDLDGNVLSFEKAGETSATQCFYGRRTDWEKFYKIAETYLTSAVIILVLQLCRLMTLEAVIRRHLVILISMYSNK